MARPKRTPRLFRLDRIAAAEVLDAPVTTEPSEPRDLSDGMFSRSEETTLVTLRLAPAARWVTEYYPVEAVRALDDGSGDVEVDLLVADERWLVDDTVEVAVQVNGKVRAQVAVPADADAAALEAAARADERVVAQLDGKTVRRVIAVPGRLVNFVVG